MKKISKEEKEELVVCTSNALLFLGEDDEKPCFTDIPHKIKRFNTEEEAKEYFSNNVIVPNDLETIYLLDNNNKLNIK